MRKTFKKLTIFNNVILYSIAIIITLFRFLQLKYFTNFELACNNFKNKDFLNFNVNSKILSCFIIILTFIYILYLFFYTIKKNKHCLKHGILQLTKQNDNNDNIDVFTKTFLIVAALISLVGSISYLNSYKSEMNIIIMLIFMFQILFTVYFSYLLICFHFNRYSKKNILNIIFIIPVIWGIMRIFSIRILLDFLFLTRREFLLYNLKIVTITVFFFCFGKFLIGFNSRKNENLINFFGYSSIFFTFISVIPRIIFYFFNNKDFENFMAKKVYLKNIDILNTGNFIIMDLIILIFTIISMKKLTSKTNSKISLLEVRKK